MEDINIILNKTKELYVQLLAQRDRAKSTTLKNLLNRELESYVLLSKTAGDYFRLYKERLDERSQNISEYLHNSLENIKEINDPGIVSALSKNVSSTYEVLCSAYELEVSILEMAERNYANAASRDFKDWNEFAKMLGSKVGDLVGDSIPIISEVKGLYDNVKDIAEIINELEENGTDYSEMDIRLLEIERHISIMDTVRQLFCESICMLEKEDNQDVFEIPE